MDQLPPPFGGDYFNNYAPLVIVVLCGCTYAIGCAPLRARLRTQLHSQFAPTSVARTCPAGTLTSVRACSRAVPSVSRAWPAPARPSLSTRISRTRASITAPPSWSRRRRRSPTECVWAPSPRRRVLTLIAMDLPWTCHGLAMDLPSTCHPIAILLPSAAIGCHPIALRVSDRSSTTCVPSSIARSQRDTWWPVRSRRMPPFRPTLASAQVPLGANLQLLSGATSDSEEAARTRNGARAPARSRFNRLQDEHL